MARIKKILIKPYKAHRHMYYGVYTRPVQQSYKGVALTPFEQIVAIKLNELIEWANSQS